MGLRGIDADTVAHRRQLPRRQHRRLAAFEDVAERRLLELPRRGSELLGRLRCLDEPDVGARLEVRVHAVDRRLQTLDGARVRARDDDHVRIAPRVHRRLDLADHLRLAHQLLALVVAALLGRDLVFEMEGGDAGLLVLPHAADHVERVAVAGVHVGDHRDVQGVHRARDVLRDLGHREQAHVRIAGRARVAAAGEVDRLESRDLHEPRGQRVVGARHDGVGVFGEQLAQLLSRAHECTSGVSRCRTTWCSKPPLRK